MPFLPTSEWSVFVGALAGLGAVVGLGEVLHHSLGWRAEASRRVVHALTGVFVVLCPLLFEGPGWVLLMATGFLGVNALALRKKWLSGMHATRRRTVGTVTFPLALLVGVAMTWALDETRVFALQTAFAVLAVADPLAAVVGESLPAGRRLRAGGGLKTVAGTVTFALATFSITSALLFNFLMGGLLVWSPGTVVGAALLVTVLATVAELVSGRGWDNLTIVLAVVVPLVALHEAPDALDELLGAAVLAGGFGWAALRWRLLDASGAVVGSLLAFAVVGLGGWAWAVPGFVFFGLASGLSKLGKERKAAAEAFAEKGSRRDAGQVLANGGVAWALLLAWVVWPQPALYWGFLGAFAASAADTWATEVGTYVKGPTRLITTGQPVQPGQSGGLSIAGLSGALAGAGSVWMAAVFAGPEWVRAATFGPSLLAIVGGGVLASLVDSVLGATVQAQYRDARSGALTERAVTAVGLNPLVRGREGVTNDVVNVVATVVGAAFAVAVVLVAGQS